MPIDRRAVVLACVLAVLGSAALAVADASAQLAGTKRVLVIPVRHQWDCAPPVTCFADRRQDNDDLPREGPAEWQRAISGDLNTFYGRESYFQLRWDVRVLGNPSAPSGWWPAPHRISGYARGDENFNGNPGIVRDAAETILANAIRRRLITRREAESRPYLLVIDSYAARGGQSARRRVDYLVDGALLQTYPAVVSQDVSIRAALTVVRHELAHSLLLPDLYSAPRADVNDADGDGNRTEFGPHICDTLEPGSVAMPIPAPGFNGDCVGPWELLGWDSFGGGFGGYGKILAGWLRPGTAAVRELPNDFSGEIEIEALERPSPGRPVVLRMPRLRAGALSAPLMLAGRDATPFTGLEVECRRNVDNDAGLPGQGLVVSWIDETLRAFWKVVARTAPLQPVTQAFLGPGQTYLNPTLGVQITHRGFSALGGCEAAINVREVPILSGGLIAGGLARTIAAATDLDGRKRSLSVFAASGVHFGGGRLERLSAPRRGGRETLQFAYQGGESGIPGGRATLHVTQPYTAAATCDGATTTFGRPAGSTPLPALGAGAVGVAGIGWRSRSAGSFGARVTLAIEGDQVTSDNEISSAAVFLTHRLQSGRAPRPQRFTLRVAVPRRCTEPVTFGVSALTAPSGWTVRATGTGKPVLPGRSRLVSVSVTAPRNAPADTYAIPLAVTENEAEAEPAEGHTGHGNGRLAGGLDIIARVVRGARRPAPFVLNAGDLNVPRRPPSGPLFPIAGSGASELSLTCQDAPLGQAGALTGSLVPGRDGAVVSVALTTPDGRSIERAASTGADGGFALGVELDVAGTWTATASHPGGAGLQPASSSCSFSVAAPAGGGPVPRAPSQLTLDCPKTMAIGTSTKVTGAIDPAHAAPVGIRRQAPSATTVSDATTSTADGTFSFAFAPDEAGDWILTAGWNGDDDHTGASATCTVPVTK